MTTTNKSYFLILLLSLALYNLPAQARRHHQDFTEIVHSLDYELTGNAMIGRFDQTGKTHILFPAVDLDQARLLLIFQADNNGISLIRKIKVPENFIMYDVAKGGKSSEIWAVDNKGVYVFDWPNNRWQLMVQVDSLFIQEKAQYLSQVDFVKDLNGDNQDDIILPGLTEQLLFWRANNQWHSQSLPIKPFVTMQNRSISYLLPVTFSVDMNQDDKPDFVEVSENALRIFFWRGDGFLPKARIKKLPFKVSPLDWWRLKDASGETIDQSHIDHRRIQTLRDLNGDGLADIMIQRQMSKGVLERKTAYEFYFARINKGQLAYSETSDASLEFSGTLAQLQLVDLDEDGRLEVALGSFEIGVSQIIGALLSGSIDVDLKIMTMGEDFNYELEPILNEEVALEFSLTSGRSGAPVVLTADLNGDGLKEVILSRSEKSLKIYWHDKDKQLSNRSKRLKIQLPEDGDMVQALDVDGDGQDELVMRYGRLDDENMRNLLRVVKVNK